MPFIKYTVSVCKTGETTKKLSDKISNRNYCDNE